MDFILKSGPYPLFRSVLSKAANKTCLVLGAGYEVSMVNEYSKKVIGINISKKNTKKIRHLNVDPIIADAQKLPIKDSCISLVICKSALHHFNDIHGSFLEMNRVADKNAYFYLYEPGLLNVIAYFGRHVFPTEIHEPSEKPFIPSNLRKTVVSHFDVVTEKGFFIFVHAFPILEKLLNIKSQQNMLKLLMIFDNLLSGTYFRNLCWVITFILKKKSVPTNYKID